MKLFLLAGEASGDKLGADLIAGLKAERPDIAMRGVAGPRMQAAGMDSLFPMEELSVMGISEVLPRYPALRRRLAQAVDAVVAWQPDALITIDSPDFSLRLAKQAKAALPSMRTVHYVAPSVWAWRPGRAAKMARFVDQVLALLPFEPPYMEAAGMRCDFVGHPIVSEPLAGAADVSAFRDEVGEGPIVLVLPGSRRSEVTRLLPVFEAVVARLASTQPDVRVVVPAAPGVVEAVKSAANGWTVAPLVIDPSDWSRKQCAFQAADVALAASGTVSLELAAAATPMVVAYDMSWLSWQVMSRMARIDTVTLVNLVTDTRTVPEFLGPACQPEPIAKALLDLLDNPTKRFAQIEAMERTMEALGQGGKPPGQRAARAILDGLAAI